MSQQPGQFHVLHLPRWYPNREDAMPGLFVKNHAHSLLPFCRNTILYLHLTYEAKSAYEVAFADDHGLKTYIIYIGKAKTGLEALNLVINAFRYFYAFFKGYALVVKNQGKPDLLHVHVLTRPAIAAILIKWFYKIPFVISEHWSRYFAENGDYGGWLRRKLTKLAVNKSEGLICVSGALQEAMKQHGLGQSKMWVVPNVVNTRHFKPLPEKEEKSALHLVHVSCFEDKSKNISGLLHAIKLLDEGQIGYTLELIGEGADLQKMKELAVNLSLHPTKVIFTGLLQNEELAQKMATADFLIQTSYYETFSTVVIESLACGVPVISTKVGVFNDLVSENIGIAIQSPAPESIAEAIEKAHSRRGSFNRDKLHEIAQNHFSKQVVGEMLFGIYKQISGKK